ncbi:hypothetical protein ACFRDV_20345 [Streptomyces fagopyri]|uniref:hypothetical protein n=1 Tax=Streptomyces fagopyri TaxID=2662397 RepID=UPI0036AC9C05
MIRNSWCHVRAKGGHAGDGAFVARRVLEVAAPTRSRTDGLDGLKPSMEDAPGTIGRGCAYRYPGTADVAGVRGTGNGTDRSPGPVLARLEPRPDSQQRSPWHRGR